MTHIFSHSKKMVMIVARYNENLDWLKKVPWEYVVYNKGGDLPTWIKNEIKLQNNIGREMYAYLTFIIDNYYTLPDYSIFVHGSPFDHSPELIKIITNFEGKDDFLPLANVSVESYKKSEMGPELAESIRRLFLDELETFECLDGSQFIVSRKTILFHAKKTYQKIKDFVMKGDSIIADKITGYRVFSPKFPRGGRRLFYVKKTLQEIIDSLTDEKYTGEKDTLFSPWIMEILWKTLFDNKHKTLYD